MSITQFPTAGPFDGIDLLETMERAFGGQDELSPLTDLEAVALRMLADGAGRKQIATELYRSATTICNLINAALDKLGAVTEIQGVVIAMEHDWI